MELLPGELATWVRAFAFTQAVEVPIYTALLSLPRAGLDLSLRARVAVAFLCSLLTHPVVWFVFPRVVEAYTDYAAMVVSAELYAVGGEAIILYGLGVAGRWAIGAALVANMTSLSLGFLVRYLFGWI